MLLLLLLPLLPLLCLLAAVLDCNTLCRLFPVVLLCCCNTHRKSHQLTRACENTGCLLVTKCACAYEVCMKTRLAQLMLSRAILTILAANIASRIDVISKGHGDKIRTWLKRLLCSSNRNLDVNGSGRTGDSPIAFLLGLYDVTGSRFCDLWLPTLAIVVKHYSSVALRPLVALTASLECADVQLR